VYVNCLDWAEAIKKVAEKSYIMGKVTEGSLKIRFDLEARKIEQNVISRT